MRPAYTCSPSHTRSPTLTRFDLTLAVTTPTGSIELLGTTSTIGSYTTTDSDGHGIIQWYIYIHERWCYPPCTAQHRYHFNGTFIS